MNKAKTGSSNLLLFVVIVIAVIAVFSNSFNGEFVYDDQRQILRNALIQNPELYSKALTSDVWAFKADGNYAASNYWRPTFTAFSILNYLLFGPDPFGWHLINVLLHAAVCLLIFLILERLGMDRTLSFACTLLFAVHPVHVESVTWIAGSPDLLFALFLLVSMWFGARFAQFGNRTDLWASVAAFVPALGAKEVALLSIPIYFLIFRDFEEPGKSKPPFLKTAPFLAAGLLYFLMRWIVLGRLLSNAPNAAGSDSILFTAPSLFLFYLKQTVFPAELGPNYAIRPEEGVSGIFLVSLVVSVAILVGMFFVAKRSKLQMIGLAVFLLPLAPAFLVTSFIPEQIAHDRYLYLPLLGFLMMFVPELYRLAKKIGEPAGTRLFLAAVILAAILCSYQTYTYSRVWLNELSLWQHAVTVDSGSAFNFSQLGAVLAQNGRVDESIEAFNRSLDINPVPLAYLGRARNFVAKQKFEEAIRDLKTVTEMPAEKIDVYSLYQTYEALALSYNGKGNDESAVEVLYTARKRLPIYYAALTGKLAVVLYQQNKKEEALKELESARSRALVELLPESKSTIYRLGMLYAEKGANEKSAEVLEEYLRATSTTSDKQTKDFRKLASDQLKSIR